MLEWMRMMHLIKTIFQLHAVLMWTINDFPVYVDLSC